MSNTLFCFSFFPQKDTESCLEQDEFQQTKEGLQQTESRGTTQERYERAYGKILDCVVQILYQKT